MFGRGQKKISGASLSSSNGRGSKEKIEKVSKEKIEEIVVKIITENQNNDRETGLGEVGSRLVKVYPDLMFDVMVTACYPSSLKLTEIKTDSGRNESFSYSV